MLSRIDRNVEFASSRGPPSRIIRPSAGATADFGPAASTSHAHTRATHEQSFLSLSLSHVRTYIHTYIGRRSRHTSRNRAVRTLPCCTTNESPSLSSDPSTLRLSASFPLGSRLSGHRDDRSQSRFVQSTAYAHIYRFYRSIR